MPLSKKRMAERKKQDRMSNLNTMPIIAYDSDGTIYRTEVISPFVKPNYEPLPNCPDGRYRRESKPVS